MEDCPEVVAAFGGVVFVGFVDDYAGFSVGFEGVGDGDVVVVFDCVVVGGGGVFSGADVYGFEVCQVVGG